MRSTQLISGIMVAAVCMPLFAQERNADKPDGILPELGATPSLSGNLKEWADATTIPVRGATHITKREPDRKWLGPEDAGMEVFCGWTRDGLCLAFLRTDDELLVNDAVDQWWKRDCIEIFLDGRQGDRQMTRGYGPGVYQLFAVPLAKTTNGPVLARSPRNKRPEGAKIASKKLGKGCFVECIIPWSAFPDFQARPGSILGMQFGLDDHDSRDGKAQQPFQMTCQGRTGLHSDPSQFFRFQLAGKGQRRDAIPVGLLVSMDVPRYISEERFRCKIDVGQSLSKRAATCSVRIVNPQGRTAYEDNVSLVSGTGTWQDMKEGTFEWEASRFPDGRYAIDLTVKDTSGSTLGTTRATVVNDVNAVLANRLRAKGASPLAGKNVVFIADSLGSECGRPSPDGKSQIKERFSDLPPSEQDLDAQMVCTRHPANGSIHSQGVGYPYWIARDAHCKVYDIMQSGWKMVNGFAVLPEGHTDYHHRYTNIGKVYDLIFSEGKFKRTDVLYTYTPDYIIFSFGTNDNTDLGRGAATIGEDINKFPADFTWDTSTVWGAWNKVLIHCVTEFPYAKIGIICDGSTSGKQKEVFRALAKKYGCGFLDLQDPSATPALYYNAKELKTKFSPTPLSVAKRRLRGCVKNYEVGDKIYSFYDNKLNLLSYDVPWGADVYNPSVHSTLECHRLKATIVLNWMLSL